METITVVHCPLCGSTISQSFDSRIFKEYPIENRCCSNCGIVYQSPHMSDEALEKFYMAEYRKLVQGFEGPTPKDIFVQENRARALSAFVRRCSLESIEPATHLDIGCSTGTLMAQFKREFNLQTVGVEPGTEYRNYGLQRGLDISASLDDIKLVQRNSFGLISLIHVLEHLPRPTAYLENLKNKFLSANGYLLVEVPNLYAHNSFEVAHLVSFSKHTLQETITKAGFTTIALRAHGEPRSKTLPLYLTLLAKPTQRSEADYVVRPERWVKARRRYGVLRRRILERFASRWTWLPIPE